MDITIDARGYEVDIDVLTMPNGKARFFLKAKDKASGEEAANYGDTFSDALMALADLLAEKRHAART